MHVLCAIRRYFWLLADGLVDLADEETRDEQDDEHDQIEHYGPILVDLEHAHVFATELLSHESSRAEREAHSD